MADRQSDPHVSTAPVCGWNNNNLRYTLATTTHACIACPATELLVCLCVAHITDVLRVGAGGGGAD